MSSFTAQLFTDFFVRKPTLLGENIGLYPAKMSRSSSEPERIEFSDSEPEPSLPVTSYHRREAEVEDSENTQRDEPGRHGEDSTRAYSDEPIADDSRFQESHRVREETAKCNLAFS